MLTYQQAINLKKGDRLKAEGSFGCITGTIVGKGKENGSPVLWIKHDDEPKKGFVIAYFISTDLNEYGWNNLDAGRDFELLETQPNLFDLSD
ncbi:hypothetical protein AWH48_12160 [Domibacillus aminovorans]|uniref:Uncharacterized protein n=1 Tax=Domibacillus aminovorans TaxID=29332 RepID=A0A177KJ05_9BACI|nr:hypothetical protein [Domibacillus aminovorans]OAH53104.1 hypothetical protein AWH48_12160 [Domibacillus aminovorans]